MRPVPALSIGASTVGRRAAQLALAARLTRASAAAYLALVLAIAAALRLWQLNSVGLQQRRGGLLRARRRRSPTHPVLDELFPVFRAHPAAGPDGAVARVPAAPGRGLRAPRDRGASAWRPSTWSTSSGRLLYGRRGRADRRLLVALMPYHVVVTRQVLLDGPMTFFATLTLVLLARFVLSGRAWWLYARRRGDGTHVPVEGDEHRPARRDLRVPGAHARAARAAARPRRLAGGHGAGDRAVSAQPACWPGAPAPARATSPGSCSGGPTTTGSSTPRRCPRRSARWCCSPPWSVSGCCADEASWRETLLLSLDRRARRVLRSCGR